MTSKRYFDDVASSWDQMQESFFSEEVRDVALSTAGVKPGETALDVGEVL